MIRLAVHGVDDVVRECLAIRLRGASVETERAGLDAGAFLGAGQPAPGAVERLLRSGTSVLIGTDMPLPLAALEALTVAAREGAARLSVVNPDRHLPSRRLIREQLDTGKLGEVGLIRLHRWEPNPSHDSLPPLVRDLDLTLWLMDRTPNLVYAVGNDRLTQVHLGFPGGGMALIDHGYRLPAGDGYQSLSVISSAGAAYADDHQNMQLLYRGGRPQAVRTEEGVRQMASLIQEFIDGLKAGVPLTDSLASWQTVWAVAEAVRGSLQSRQAVVLGGR